MLSSVVVIFISKSLLSLFFFRPMILLFLIFLCWISFTFLLLLLMLILSKLQQRYISSRTSMNIFMLPISCMETIISFNFLFLFIFVQWFLFFKTALHHRHYRNVTIRIIPLLSSWFWSHHRLLLYWFSLIVVIIVVVVIFL